MNEKRINFDCIKDKISKMSASEFLLYFDTDIENILCHEMPTECKHCEKDENYNCSACVKEYLERECDND